MSPAHLHDWLRDSARPSLVMGILNVTPDSFSDGGRFARADAAVRHAAEMAAAGADWIDVGGESTRPGSARVDADEQLRRVLPVLREIAASLPTTVLSIDTTLAPVASAALDAGAGVVNDISAGRDDADMLPLVARRGVPVVLMHMQGEPATMQVKPTYTDVTDEVRSSLAERLAAAVAAGVDPQRVLLDPGIGFGKTVFHNLELLRRLPELAALGRPLVVGASRKRFLVTITGETDPHRPFSTAASVAWAAANGAAVVRVHDVGPMSQVVRMIRAIQNPGGHTFTAGPGGHPPVTPV